MSTLRIPGIPPPSHYHATVETRAACHLTACLRIPAHVYAAVRTDEVEFVVRAFGPFAEKADAKTFVAEKLAGDGHVVPFELVFHQTRRSRPPFGTEAWCGNVYLGGKSATS